MPLQRSGTREAISSNIRDMIASGHPRQQAIAAALSTADRYGKRRAAGGSSGSVVGSSGGTSGSNATATQNTSTNAQIPTVSAYSVPSSMSDQNVLPSGLMKTPTVGVGGYYLDQNTGALSPETQNLLSSYAQRGLPSASSSPGYASATPATPATQAVIPGQTQTDPSFQGSGGGGGMRNGGRLAAGGVPNAPWFVRSEAHAMDHPAGLIRGLGGGRTDTVPMNVSSGSHVVPADVLSGLGAGSSNAGAHAMDAAMSTGPGGLRLPKGPVKPMAFPHAPAMPTSLARGGNTEALPVRLAKGLPQGGVKCVLANDEYLIPPHEVERIEHAGKKGHEAVDKWILEMRGNTIKTMKKLPGPVGAKS